MPLPTKLTLEFVTPDRAIAHESVDEVQIPGSEGYLSVLPGHTPLLTTLDVGEFSFRQGAETTFVSIADGFAEVLPDRVTILAQIAERADEIDVNRAEQAEQRARQRMEQSQADSGTADLDFERARIAALKALVRLRVASRIGRGGPV
jgi:F-type H+-transporting ATPase subunit epsilon